MEVGVDLLPSGIPEVQRKRVLELYRQSGSPLISQVRRKAPRFGTPGRELHL